MTEIELIKELRELTGVSVAQIKKALVQAQGVREHALEKLKEWGAAVAAKKADRALGAGVVQAYVHNSRVGALIQLSCETDFVARNEEFLSLARDLAMHASALRPESVGTMLEQPFIKDEGVTVRGRIEQAVAKLGENIQLTGLSVLALA